jgi:hypothetical protein
MIKLIFASLVLLSFTGCASSAVSDRMDSLEQQMSGIQRTADQALDMARQAQAKATDTASGVGEAQRMARQAMDTATETAERLSRMEDECCGGK